ncbi:MAG: hypothetical protein ACXABY_34580 [Candidatus Thorarchaeota archaeon]|jgi:hypothetical protein
MSNVHGSKARLKAYDQTGTEQDLSGDITSVTFSRSKNNPESTTFGNTTVQRIDGLRDVTMDVTAIWEDNAADGVVSFLDDMQAGSLTSLVDYFPGGSVAASGSPQYSACYRLNSYAQNSPVDGITTVNFSMSIGSGSVTATCIS